MIRFGQPKYVKEILKHLNVENYKHVSTPLEVNCKL
jgi:hypothetical protein